MIAEGTTIGDGIAIAAMWFAMAIVVCAYFKYGSK